MKNILVKNTMTSIEDYATITEDQTLYDVFQVLEDGKKLSAKVHRDLIVLDNEGQFKGKVTILDIFKALEPKYKQLKSTYTDGTLTSENILKSIRDFDLWLVPMKDLCERGSNIKVSEIMHIPDKHEYILEEESLEKALHEYVMGVHQPLIVKHGDKVTGILRLEDLYEIIREHMLACKI
jgi:CBS domain-containing protein